MPKFVKGQSGNPKGRPKGLKDLLPRGTIKNVYQELIERYNGHDLMVDAVRDALKKKGRLALNYIEVGARVLDRIEDDTGSKVQIIFAAPLDKGKLQVTKGKQSDAG